MAGLKRFLRHGLVISGLGHAGVLAIGLLLVWASPQDAIPPDAMLVEVVTPKEIPRLSGTPSELRTSGTEQGAQSPAVTPMQQPPQPPTVPAPPQKDQRQAQRNAQPKPRETKTESKTESKTETKTESKTEPQTTPPQKEAPPVTQAEIGEVPAKPSPDQPAPAAPETPDASEVAASMAQLAQLALLGGRLGGGFAAPPVDSPLVGHDFTLAFRERVSACSPMAENVDPNEKVSITVRVFLNRDGTVAAAPQLHEPNPSVKQRALMQSFVTGLQKCQPYTMLPQDKYRLWKELDLVIYPLQPLGG